MIIKILLLILFFGVIPFGMGLLPVYIIDKKRRSIGVTYIAGFIFLLALFQLTTVPIVIRENFGFRIVVPLFTTLTCVLALAGYVLIIWRRKKDGFIFNELTEQRKTTIEEKIGWGIVLLLIAFQMFMSFYMMSFDGDDAYYVVQSVLADDTDTLYRIRPYTGLSTGMDLRHSLAVFPIWIAYIARVTGIHATIVAHTILPLVLIPLTYWIYLEIGKRLLRKEKRKTPIFMIFVCIMQIFGNVSIYTNATFFLTRTWQGKSLLANFVIPAAIWLLLWIFDSDLGEKDNRLGLWILLFMVNIVAALSSTASVFLMAMLIGIYGAVLTICEKNIQILLRLMITCIPLVLYGVMYLLI